jgi:hypothetical protein
MGVSEPQAYCQELQLATGAQRYQVVMGRVRGLVGMNTEPAKELIRRNRGTGVPEVPGAYQES